MPKKISAGTTLFAIYLILIHLVAGYLIYEKFFTTPPVSESKMEQPVSALPTRVEIPEEKLVTNENRAGNSNVVQNQNAFQANQSNGAAPANDGANVVIPPGETGKLLIPVVGIKKSDLRDTFNDARSEGRVHNAIDIMAGGGVPVVAAADGEIAKFFDSKLGGITIYQYSVDKQRVYYYAHLQKRADNLVEHSFVKQGTVIGYVGDTGNAGTGNFHLHFEISLLNDPKRYWEGTAINPFPILKDGIEAK